MPYRRNSMQNNLHFHMHEQKMAHNGQMNDIVK